MSCERLFSRSSARLRLQLTDEFFADIAVSYELGVVGGDEAIGDGVFFERFERERAAALGVVQVDFFERFERHLHIRGDDGDDRDGQLRVAERLERLRNCRADHIERADALAKSDAHFARVFDSQARLPAS